jgi:GIY-YIG catalytic domain
MFILILIILIDLSLSFIPAVLYKNAEQSKKCILRENKGKSGIYRLVNTINNKTYIGSSTNLTLRFNRYFNKNRLLYSGKRMPINLGIENYGLSNFNLEILEYCN